MKNKRSVNRLTASLLLVCTLLVGSTLAVLTNVTETATNVFASEKSISIKLREPKWDGYTFDDEYGSDISPGQSAKPGLDFKDLGISKAENYLPGDKIGKNPTVKNTSLESVYVAIKVEYIDSSGTAISKSEFDKYGKAFVDLNEGMNSKFISIDSDSKHELYMFADELASQGETDPLFTSIHINQDIDLVDGKWPTFKINVTAYAVQSENIKVDEAKKALVELAKGNK